MEGKPLKNTDAQSTTGQKKTYLANMNAATEELLTKAIAANQPPCCTYPQCKHPSGNTQTTCRGMTCGNSTYHSKCAKAFCSKHKIHHLHNKRCYECVKGYIGQKKNTTTVQTYKGAHYKVDAEGMLLLFEGPGPHNIPPGPARVTYDSYSQHCVLQTS